LEEIAIDTARVIARLEKGRCNAKASSITEGREEDAERDGDGLLVMENIGLIQLPEELR